MAINTFEVSPLGQKNVPLSLVKAVRELSSSASTLGSPSRKTRIKKSPYLRSDNIQMFSSFAAKRTVQKNNETFSSFPLAANIYKANSAEFKQRSKKYKKTALYSESRTSAIKACTVSDMSNSEYCDHKDNEKKRVKKRKTYQASKKPLRHNTIDMIDFDQDIKFDSDCCSSFKLGSKKHGDVLTYDREHDLDAEDVWSVLSKISQFQLNHSSQEVSSKNGRSSRKNKKKKEQAPATARLALPGSQMVTESRLSNRNYRNRGKGGRLIETFRTEEMTVVANIEIEQHEESRTTLSPNSSFDRLTVISKEWLDKEAKKGNKCAIKDIRIKTTKIPIAISKKQSKGGVKTKCLSITNGDANDYSKDKQNIQMVVNTTPKKFQTGIQPHVRGPTKGNFHSNLVNASNKENKKSDVNLDESQDSSKQESDHEFEGPLDKAFKETKEEPRKRLPRNANKIENKNYYLGFGEANEQITAIKNCNHKSDDKPTFDKRLVVQTPAVKIMPKMTLTEIRKKLRLIRYPLTILNNNQLSSTIQVFDVDPPQYYGLDRHVWPFMRDWMVNKTEKSEELRPGNIKIDSFSNNFLNLIGKGGKTSKSKNMTQEIPRITPGLDKTRNPMIQIKDKVVRIWQRAPHPPIQNLYSIGRDNPRSPNKLMSNEKSEMPNTYKRPKAELKGNTEISQNAKSHEAASKEIVAIFDNSKNLVLKENVKIIEDENGEIFDNIQSSRAIFSEIKDTLRRPKAVLRENAKSPENLEELAETHFRDRLEGRHRYIIPAVLRYPWAKAKQASEFVETVLAKIKKGVYSQNECNAPNENVTNILDKIKKGVYYRNESNVSNNEVVSVLDKIKKEVSHENECHALNEEVANVLDKIKKGIYYENKCQVSKTEVAEVLNKVKKGVYYDNECNVSNEVDHSSKIIVSATKLVSPSNDGSTQLFEFDYKDVSIQTLTWNENKNELPKALKDETNQSSPDCNPTEADLEPDVVIPGFEETLPQLEVETIGCNQITVKHRLQNVTVQFDVAVPSKKSRSYTTTSNGKESMLIPSCCVPMAKKKINSKTQVYKCNTTILNTALPAELCTVLPALLKNMFRSGTCLPETTAVNSLSVPGYDNSEKGPPLRRKIQFKLQNPGYRLPWFATSKIPVCPPFIVSPELIEMSKGHYSSKADRLAGRSPLLACSKVVIRFELRRRVVVSSLDIPQARPIVQKLVYIVVDPLQFVMSKPNSADIEEPRYVLESVAGQSIETVERFSQFSLCNESLKLKKSETEAVGIVALQLTSLHDITLNYCKFNIGFALPTFTFAQFQRLLGINTPQLLITNIMPITTVETALPAFDDCHTMNNMATISSSKKLVLKSSHSYCDENRVHETGFDVVQKVSHVKEKIKNFNELTNGCKKYNVRRDPFRGSHSPNQKKIVVGFRKFYKKCRSQIFSNRMPLETISNVDDFIQTLGSAKHLASVFNGISGVSLMNCVEEMKKWIKEISSKQALLVLMLMSKKDTSNMIRLRPLVLQGIAMNRITRAKELEMEIEVLSQENLQIMKSNTLYSTMLEPNKGCNLLEELCWIAKNTASDSQRPYDEKGVELFLKNLLQKRKNMNPSYLRVVARYVGLGLIKGQRKG